MGAPPNTAVAIVLSREADSHRWRAAVTHPDHGPLGVYVGRLTAYGTTPGRALARLADRLDGALARRGWVEAGADCDVDAPPRDPHPYPLGGGVGGG